MRLRNLSIAVIALSLTGCFATAPEVKPWVPDASLKIKIDERLLEECPELPTDVVIKSDEDLIKAKGLDNKLYAVCKLRHKELSNVVRQQIEGTK